MKIIIENEGQRRFINTSFKIYGNKEDLRVIRDAIDKTVDDSFGNGWVQVGEEKVVPDTTLFPWEPTADEKPVLVWDTKPVVEK